jgi:hypothetical protein
MKDSPHRACPDRGRTWTEIPPFVTPVVHELPRPIAPHQFDDCW